MYIWHIFQDMKKLIDVDDQLMKKIQKIAEREKRDAKTQIEYWVIKAVEADGK